MSAPWKSRKIRDMIKDTVAITAGEKKRLLSASPEPGQDWYINDHTFIQDSDGNWHVFGIWHAEPANPLDEKFFLHASAPCLDGTWTVHPAVLQAREDIGETHVWAPHVIRVDDTYLMFYCGGTENHDAYRIECATSKDLFTWQHSASGALFTDGFDARDPMVLKVGDQWVMYYTRTSTPDGGTHQVAARTSPDLQQWSEPIVAFDSGVTGTFGGPTESPFVIQLENGVFILFVCESGEYDRTLAYASNDPLHFDALNLIDVDLDEHCAEIIESDEGTWISGGGWGRGGLTIRPISVAVL